MMGLKKSHSTLGTIRLSAISIGRHFFFFPMGRQRERLGQIVFCAKNRSVLFQDAQYPRIVLPYIVRHLECPRRASSRIEGFSLFLCAGIASPILEMCCSEVS